MASHQTVDLSGSTKPFIEHNPRMILGEAIQYRPSDNTLHYLDIERSPVSALFIAKLDNAGNLAAPSRMIEIQGSRHVTALAFSPSTPGSYLCTTHTGLAYLSEETGVVEDLPNGLGQIIDPGDKSFMRYNDAACDRHGRLYFHSMSKDGEKKLGKLYMYSKDMKTAADLKVLETGFTVGNGPGIDEARKRFYFNLTEEGISLVYDWDPETRLTSNRREFFNNHKRRPASLFDPLTTMLGPGLPDGHTMDEAGNIYQAVFGAGLIERFTPEGVNDLTIKLPARCPTRPVFGGPNMQTLYISTASEPLLPGEMKLGGDQGGSILRVDLSNYMQSVKGMSQPSFSHS